MADLRGRYSTPIGAARALKDFAGGGLEATAEKIAGRLGAAEVPILKAGRGDCVMAVPPVTSGIGQALGLVSMSGRTALFAGEVGLQALPLRACYRAWRV